MKNISGALLTSLFVLMSLISLLSADIAREDTQSEVVIAQGSVSDLGLRFAFKR